MANKVSFYILGLSAFLLLSNVAAAQTSVGTENITFSANYLSVPQGGIANVTYNVSVISGSWQFATIMYIGNNAQLANKNIVVLLKPTTGNPPLVGKMYVSPRADTPLGSYYVLVQGYSQNVTVNPASFLVFVVPPPPKTTSVTFTSSTTSAVVTSTMVSATVSTTSLITTAVQKTGQGSGGNLLSAVSSNNVYVIIAIMVVVFIIVAIFLLRTRGGGNVVQSGVGIQPENKGEPQTGQPTQPQ